MKSKLFIASLFVAFASLAHAETMPAKPDRYFNDYAKLVTPEQASQLNEELAQYERETSNQFVVATFEKMDTSSDAADYTQRIAQSWQVGQKDKNNGLVLFVFMNPRKIQIQVGYGLEGAIPDASAFQVTERVMKPRFKQKDFYGGFAAGITELKKYANGEYKGTGKTVAETPTPIDFSGFFTFLWWTLWLSLAASLISWPFLRRRRQRRLAAEAEKARLRAIQQAEWERQIAESRRIAHEQAEKRRLEWEEYLRNETPDQKTARLAAEALAAEKAQIAVEERRKRRRSSSSSSSYGGYSSSSSYGSSSSSSSSSSSFSSGGGSFGGGGAGSDF